MATKFAGSFGHSGMGSGLSRGYMLGLRRATSCSAAGYISYTGRTG